MAAIRKDRHMKLRSMMRYRGISQLKVASLLGYSQTALTKKLRGDIPWTLEDVYRVGMVLDIPTPELLDYFPNVWLQPR